MRNKALLLIGMALSFSYANAQVSKSQATNLVLNSVVQGQADSVNVFVNQTLQSSGCFDDILSPIEHLETVTISEDSAVAILWDAPSNLLSDAATLSWTGWGKTPSFPVGWDCGTEDTISVASCFDSLDLRNFYGWRVNQIAFLPCDTAVDYAVNVWYKQGDNVELVYERMVTNCVYNEENVVDLDADIFIGKDEGDLMIGYSAFGNVIYSFCVSYVNTFYMKRNYDYNGSVHNEWHPSFGPAMSWWVKAYIESPEHEMVQLGKCDRTELTGYNVYRNGERIARIPFAIQTYFIDESVSKMSEYEYCVTAVYGDEESEMVCTSYTGVDETMTENRMTAHPNPTTGIVRVERDDIMEIQVYNSLGQQMTMVQNTNEVNLSTFDTGVYVLRIQMNDGTTSTTRVLRL